MFEFFQILQLKHTLSSLTCLHKLANSLVARNVAMIWDNNTTLIKKSRVGKKPNVTFIVNSLSYFSETISLVSAISSTSRIVTT